MELNSNSFFSTVCDAIMTTINNNQYKVTSENFITALTITVRDNVPLLKVGCTPFQMLVDKENVKVKNAHAFR